MEMTLTAATLPEYEGVKIAFTTQIADVFGCSVQNVTANFRAHRADFIAGVDYFYLDGQELKEFKATLTAKKFFLHSLKQVTNTYLWTQSGFEKLAKYFTTDTAKLTYSAALFGQFQSAEISAKIPKLKNEPQKNFLSAFSAHEKINCFLKIAELTTDLNLREDCLKTAYSLLK